MMKNANMPAATVYETDGEGILQLSTTGLTKREMFAMVAMQGILTRSANTDRSAIACYAVKYADALLAELERT